MKRILFVVGLVAIVTACSAEVSIGTSSDLDSEAAALLLNKEFEDSLGLGELETKCAVPNDLEEGDEFSCTSKIDSGQTIMWTAVATSSTSMDVESENVLNEDAAGQLESAAAEALAREGLPVVADDIDCGGGTLVLGDSDEVVCGVVDRSTGDVYDTTITITDISSLQFDVVIADTPRD